MLSVMQCEFVVNCIEHLHRTEKKINDKYKLSNILWVFANESSGALFKDSKVVLSNKLYIILVYIIEYLYNRCIEN